MKSEEIPTPLDALLRTRPCYRTAHLFGLGSDFRRVGVRRESREEDGGLYTWSRWFRGCAYPALGTLKIAPKNMGFFDVSNKTICRVRDDGLHRQQKKCTKLRLPPVATSSDSPQHHDPWTASVRLIFPVE